MKAVVVHQYGGPEVLKFEEYPDPIPGAGEVLVRVAATSINPFDIMRRSGSAKDVAPIKFPGIVGVDVSGTVLKIGPRVEGFSIGDRVFAMADQSMPNSALSRQLRSQRFLKNSMWPMRPLCPSSRQPAMS
jgi:NADPH:quinone reductase-like Zn-dependent oxidoreductase